MPWPKACGPLWFGDQLRSRLSLLSWRRPRPQLWWWRELLSWWLSTLSTRCRASMVFRASRLGPRLFLTAGVAAPPPSPRSRCWEGGGFGPCADGVAARPRSERWSEDELSACCAAAASSNAFSCWRTRRSSEVAASRQPRGNMAAAARFCDAHRKSGRASLSAFVSTFVPSLARQLLPRAGPRACDVGAWSCGWSAAGRRSCWLPFPSRGSSCTGMSCAGCWSRGSASMPALW
jgi:hypothetical protein